MYISKEFELHSHMGHHSLIPLPAVQACLGGKHTPVNPHRQRLLVASQKQAKLKPKAAAKCKSAAGGTVDTAGTNETVPAPAKAKKAAAAATKPAQTNKGPKTETAYITAKKAFVAQLLGCKIRLSFTGTTQAYEANISASDSV